MNKIIIFSLILIIVGCSDASVVDCYDDKCYLKMAQDKYKEQNGYNLDVIKALEKSAKLGNDTAQYKLGLVYSEKQLNFYNYKKAEYWLSKQIIKENADAAYMLGMAITEKQSYKIEDLKKAEELFNISKLNGKFKDESYEALAIIFYRTPKNFLDYKKAYKYSLDAAKRGIPSAQNILGDLYLEGGGVERDINKAIYWYKLDEEKKDLNSINSLAKIYSENDLLRDDKMALNYFEKGYELGSYQSAYYLGEAYYNGELGLKVDKDKGIKLLRKAWDGGYEKAEKYNLLFED